MEQPYYAYGQQSAELSNDPSDQPLDFTPRFIRDHDPHMQPNYTHDSGVPARGLESVTAVPSVHAWSSPAAPGAVYPPIHSSGPQVLSLILSFYACWRSFRNADYIIILQVDPSLTIQSPIPGHSGSVFGRMPGQNFQPIVPPVNAPFGSGIGTFPGDAYGSSSVSDRPKKVRVSLYVLLGFF